MSPNDFYSRFLDRLVPGAAAVPDVEAVIRFARSGDHRVRDPIGPRVAGRVVGRIADGRIIPLTPEDAEA